MKKKIKQNKPKKTNWLDLKSGDEVRNGHIGKIYYSSKSYIIYTTKENPEVLSFENDEELGPNIIQIMPGLGRLRSQFISASDKVNYFPQIASAFSLAFENDVAGANKFINDLISDCEKRRADRNNSQLTYQGTCLLFVSINIVLAFILRYWTQVPSHTNLWLYFNIALWGSFGGFLSITYKLNKFEYEINGSRNIRILSAFCRIFIAILSSGIVFSLIQSNIVLGLLNGSKNNTNPHLYYSLAVLSGFSESFVPDLMKVLEKKTVDRSQSVSEK